VHASQIVTRDASGIRLRVDRAGRALVEYDAAGVHRFVLASRAVNALPPTSGEPQVRFALDYSAARFGRRALSRRFQTCGAYDGPALVWMVAACKAPDGSYWALQAWQRLLPMRGFAPWRPEQRAVELHLSHWTGALPSLEISPNWTYGGSWQGLFGRLTYQGNAVYAVPGTPRYGRYLYIDVLDSAYGPGWNRETAVAAHRRTGGFCYSFVPQAPPPGYPSSAPRGPGNGTRHRVTVMGPGVTPIVQWEGPGLGRYDPVRDQSFNSVFDRMLAGDRVCSRER
jgi:hypothetical protein